MKYLFSKTTPTRAIIIATNKDDADTLQFQFDNNMIFGFYMLSHRIEGVAPEEQPCEWIGILEKKYGIIALAIGHFQCVEGFVPVGVKKEIPERKEKQPKLLINDLFNFLKD